MPLQHVVMLTEEVFFLFVVKVVEVHVPDGLWFMVPVSAAHSSTYLLGCGQLTLLRTDAIYMKP